MAKGNYFNKLSSNLCLPCNEMFYNSAFLGIQIECLDENFEYVFEGCFSRKKTKLITKRYFLENKNWLPYNILISYENNFTGTIHIILIQS
jgi:hypothetical protein